MTRLNTSYAQKYVVVSKSATSVTLRVADDALYQTYWKEFISADPVLDPDSYVMNIRIEQAPPAITLVDQFSNFIPELPLVWLEVAGRRYNVTSRVTFNTPNTEVPGLFRIDYRLDLGKKASTAFWESYVSIQQRPLLRKAAAGWVRDSYIIQTLNRLVMEPQFMEAIHAAGEPLYGFMQANQHPAIRASQLEKYANIEVWGGGDSAGVQGDSTIFITGLKLPQGSIVIYRQRILQLKEPVYPEVSGGVTPMDHETYTRAPKASREGTVCRSGKTSYICVRDTDSPSSFEDTSVWKTGYLYRFSALDGAAIVLPKRRIPIEKGNIEHVWVTVDNQGYPFWVDIAHTAEIGVYRGHYDKKNFADYGSGDLVSYVDGESIRLFSRKRTDIQAADTLIYPPGHYRNPAWEEVYCHLPDDTFPLLSEYYVLPHTNATNAIIAKTWSVSEEMCRAYSHMVGIPESIVNACGAKWSALLFALLTRTRNTYDGFRMCMRAVGFDVRNLRLTDPDISYECDGVLTSDIYAQHENLRKIAENISTLAPIGQYEEKEGCLRYNAEDPGVIEQYTNGSWVSRYRFSRIEPAQCHNNRYYDGDIDVLARLAEDAVKDLGDEKTWIKGPSWSGEYSKLIADVIEYEIPIYVWVRLHLHLYDESKIETETAIYSGILDGQRCGGRITLELFPSRHFNLGNHNYVEIPTGVYHYIDGEWREIEPSRYNEERSSKIYDFDTVQYPIRIRARDLDKNIFVRYWQSTHTFGLLGLAESESTDHFRDVTDPNVTDESDLMLANGYVGVTALYRPKNLRVETGLARRWTYILGEGPDGDVWKLSETEPFTTWVDAAANDIYPVELDMASFKEALAEIRADLQGGAIIPFAWDGDTLILKGPSPAYACFKDIDGNVLGAISLTPPTGAITSDDCAEYGQVDTVKLTFAPA